MTDPTPQTTRGIEAPTGYLFGEGVVLISPALESEGQRRAQLIFRDNWDHPEPFGREVPRDHPRAFWDKDTPVHPPEDTTTLVFASAGGLANLIHELVNLHALRYPGEAIPLIPDDAVRAIAAERYRPADTEVFGRLREVASPAEQLTPEEFVRREGPNWAHVESAVAHVRAGRGDTPAGAGAEDSREVWLQALEEVGPRTPADVTAAELRGLAFGVQDLNAQAQAEGDSE